MGCLRCRAGGIPGGGCCSDRSVLLVERSSDLAEPLHGEVVPVRQLVVCVPAPGRVHRQHEDPAVVQQVVVDTRVVVADSFRRMGEVELDRSTAARLQVYAGSRRTVSLFES